MSRWPCIALVLLAACGGASTRASAGAPPPTGSAPSAARNPDIITQAEVAQQQDITNAWDLVRRLRPNFLRVQERSSMRTTPAAPLVRVNGQLLGEVAELRNLEASRITEIRFYSVVQAESAFSGARGRPVINVTLRQ